MTADLAKIGRLLESIRVNAEGALDGMNDWGHVQRSLTMVAEDAVEAQGALHSPGLRTPSPAQHCNECETQTICTDFPAQRECGGAAEAQQEKNHG